MSERAAGAKAERVPQAGDLARGWGCLVALVGIAVAFIGVLLPEDGVGTVLMSLGGSAFGVGALLVVLGVLARLLLPTRA